ncbi:MAG TPA: hypothetical protein VFA33_20270 [Bryobacteraceae bacterium]|nr:hypothetical protein [Bryobacteraceae bacterium]
MAYFEKLRAMRVSPAEGLELLKLAPDVPPRKEDAAPKARRTSSVASPVSPAVRGRKPA